MRPLACKTTLAYLQYRLRHADDGRRWLKPPWQAASQTFIGGWNLRGKWTTPIWPAPTRLAGAAGPAAKRPRLGRAPVSALLHATLSPKECL